MMVLLKKVKENILGEKKEQVCVSVDIFGDSLSIIKNTNCSVVGKKMMDFISKKHNLNVGLISFENLDSETAHEICECLVFIGLNKVVNKEHNNHKNYTLKGELSLKELKKSINLIVD